MKHWRQTFSVILCMICCLSMPMSIYASSTSDLSEDRDVLAGEKDKKEDMQNTLTDMENDKTELEEVKNDLSDYVVELDGKLTNLQNVLIELDTLIVNKKEEVESMKQSLKEAEQTEADQYEAMKKRIKFMYERGNTSYISILVAAENFSDMLNKAEYIEVISQYDRSMLEDYQKTKEVISQIKDQLVSEENELVNAKKEASDKEVEMNGLIDEKNTQIENYEKDITNKEQAIKEYEAEIAAQNATIAALEAKIAQAEREAAENVSGNDVGPGSYGGGTFCWPAPSYTRISSDYGNRLPPTLGVQQFHNGVDMAAPSGSPILAASDGQVIAAAYSSTMGNYIMINHGSGIYTIYMHASALYVSSGQNVSRGQKIAAVGTTGRSTGPHLHFSVRVNGAYVSPWNYL